MHEVTRDQLEKRLWYVLRRPPFQVYRFALRPASEPLRALAIEWGLSADDGRLLEEASAYEHEHGTSFETSESTAQLRCTIGVCRLGTQILIIETRRKPSQQELAGPYGIDQPFLFAVKRTVFPLAEEVCNEATLAVSIVQDILAPADGQQDNTNVANLESKLRAVQSEVESFRDSLDRYVGLADRMRPLVESAVDPEEFWAVQLISEKLQSFHNTMDQFGKRLDGMDTVCRTVMDARRMTLAQYALVIAAATPVAAFLSWAIQRLPHWFRMSGS